MGSRVWYMYREVEPNWSPLLFLEGKVNPPRPKALKNFKSKQWSSHFGFWVPIYQIKTQPNVGTPGKIKGWLIKDFPSNLPNWISWWISPSHAVKTQQSLVLPGETRVFGPLGFCDCHHYGSSLIRGILLGLWICGYISKKTYKSRQFRKVITKYKLI